MILTKPFVAPAHRAAPTAQRRSEDLLTEAQILAMPAAQYMNAAQIDFFTARLSSIEADLVDRTRRVDSELATGAAGADPVDRATLEEEHQMALSARARDVEQLMAVRGALTRIAAGDFGYCIETGDPIGIARLLVRPTALLTMEAQQRQENLNRRVRI